MVYFLLSFCVAIEMVPRVMFFRYPYSSASLDVCIQIRHKPVIASHLQILWVFTVFNHDTSFRLLLKSHLYIQDLSLGTRFPNSISIFRLFIFFFFNILVILNNLSHQPQTPLPHFSSPQTRTTMVFSPNGD